MCRGFFGIWIDVGNDERRVAGGAGVDGEGVEVQGVEPRARDAGGIGDSTADVFRQTSQPRSAPTMSRRARVRGQRWSPGTPP